MIMMLEIMMMTNLFIMIFNLLNLSQDLAVNLEIVHNLKFILTTRFA